MVFGELVSVGGVADFGIQDDHVGPAVAQCPERIAISPAGRYFLLVNGQTERFVGGYADGRKAFRFGDVHEDRLGCLPSQLGDRLAHLLFIEGLAVPVILVLEE